MTPTIEEVKKVAIDCGCVNYDGGFDCSIQNLQAFTQHWMKVQREMDELTCAELSSDGKANTPGGACLECMEAIRNNTGE